MAWFHESQDHLPLTWWKGKPIYLAAILALAAAASGVMVAILGGSLLGFFVFSFENLFQHFYVWTPITYALVNVPSWMLVFDCLVMWRAGEGVERHFGRRALMRLAICLILMVPIVLSLLGAVGMQGLGWAGVHYLAFGLFIAFATLYPRVELSFILVTVEVWLLAAICVAVDVLGSLMMRNWVSILLLACEVGVAFGFVRYEQGQLTVASFKSVLPTRAKQALPAPRAPRPAKRDKPRATPAQLKVDDILDKISRDGMHSLTPEERVILERASDDLQKRKR